MNISWQLIVYVKKIKETIVKNSCNKFPWRGSFCEKTSNVSNGENWTTSE